MAPAGLGRRTPTTDPVSIEAHKEQPTMSTRPPQPPERPEAQSGEEDEREVRALYIRMLEGWNAHGGEAFAAPFAEDGEVIGFDGSQQIGQAEIATTMSQIFADHPTGRYVWVVRGVRLLAPDVALLRAVAGLVPAGQAEIAPALNAVQTLVAARRAGRWRIILFQNTPAQFHGRPELARQLTDELRQLL
jgi:uncharacterized protein (TIGR02246 family)